MNIGRVVRHRFRRAPGIGLGPYEIQSPLDAGAMGAVYKARDTRLDRIIGVKVLPEHWDQLPRRPAPTTTRAKR
jgi:hypothetical protein